MHSSDPTEFQKRPASPPRPPPEQMYQQPPQLYHQQPLQQGNYQPPPAYQQQPPPAYPQQQQPITGIPVTVQSTTNKPLSPWSTGLCDCCDDVSNCCITLWCPCITFGQIAEIIDSGSTSCGTTGALYALICYVTSCCCIYSCYYRTKMRNKYSLQGSCCGDFMLHFFCDCCAMCQEYRELTNRGFNVPLGWLGNVQNNPGLAMAAPVVQGGMQR